MDDHASRPVNIRRMIRLMVIKHPKLPAKDLCERVKRRGVHLTDVAITGIRSDTRETLKLLVEKGLLDLEV